MLPKIVAVIGPTASGKTALGAHLAQVFDGEIVSADAKQVYRGMDIGTAKEKDLAVPQHLLDIRNPGERIAVGEYQALAYAVIDQLLADSKLPILVGGSGLYAESVLQGYLFGGPGEKLAQARYESLKLGIEIDREVLKKRVSERTQCWIDEGLLDEIQRLLDQGVSVEWLESCGMEYNYLTQFLLGRMTREEALQKTNIAINQFIKRQYTWWRRHDDVYWVKNKEEAEELVRGFLAGQK
jgi:tRNA dimethylallyltransferase